ncbi:hypothetical protein ANCCAN_16782 [Ancylostoma caninum]|uniref:Cysteine rich repeat-containing domain protein n=1 Tax=Ancylostoma caninum TaxID=29170 RepID=A0A368G3Y0_ANCCA|nr:hypothetical protein ANCCAN_16782 [Ancylostoma caninum]
MPQPPFPVQMMVQSVALPGQCPGACQQPCQKFCGIQPIPSCMPQCQDTCVPKCAMAVPVPKPVQVMPQPSPPIMIPAPPVAPQGCTECAQKQHVQREILPFMEADLLAPGRPQCPEECMPDCEPECVMEHQLRLDSELPMYPPVSTFGEADQPYPTLGPSLASPRMKTSSKKNSV